jgi:hypothetical protein
MGEKLIPEISTKCQYKHVYHKVIPALRHEQQASSVSHDIDIGGGNFVYRAGM